MNCIKTDITRRVILFLFGFFVTVGGYIIAYRQGMNMVPPPGDIGKFSINHMAASDDFGDIVVTNVNSTRTLIYDISISDMSCKVIFMPHAIRRVGINIVEDAIP